MERGGSAGKRVFYVAELISDEQRFRGFVANRSEVAQLSSLTSQSIGRSVGQLPQQVII